MKLHQVVWMVWAFYVSAVTFSNADDAGNDAAQTSDLPENWDQAKDDTQSLFMNKNNKNDLEPYAMAISDDTTNARYDGSPIQNEFDAPKPDEGLSRVVMRQELYGEPPAMSQFDRLYNDVDRRKRGVVKIPKKSGMTRKRRSKPTAVAARPKRESGMSSADVLTLLSLWEAQQRRNQERQYSPYLIPNNYYNINPNEAQGVNLEELGDERWLDEPVISNSKYDEDYLKGREELDPYVAYYPKESSFRPESYQTDAAAGSSWDGVRRKKQWVGFRNANRVTKRFMVAKKRGDPNQSYQKNYRPREDLYSLVELLKSTPNNVDQDVPVYRRSVL